MFVSLFVSGAVSGAIYSVFAAGLVLTYSTSRVFNFAYGAIAFCSAFLFFELNTGAGLSRPLAGVLVIVGFGPLLGALLEYIVFRRLRGADDSALIMATVGLSVALPAAALEIVDLLVKHVNSHIPTSDFVVSPPGLGPSPPTIWHPGLSVAISSDQLVIFIGAVLCAIVLWLLLEVTPTGLRMRAANDSQVLAELRGVNTSRTSMLGWMFGCGLAALGGVVAAPLFALASGSYTLGLLVAATAAVLGRLRSLRVALIGGLVLGIVQNLVTGYASFADQITGFNTAVPFALLFLGLLTWRGESSNRLARSQASTVSQAPVPIGVRLGPRGTAGLWVLFVVLVIVLSDAFWLGIFSQAMAYSLIFLSLTVVLGIGGMVNLAVAAYATLGALIFGLLLGHGWPMIVALAVGVIAAMVGGLLVSLPAIRISGLALALATLAMALFGDGVLFVWNPLRNSDFGWTINLPIVAGIHLDNRKVLCGLMGALVLLVGWLVRNLRNSPSGRAMLAVRSSPAAAATAGVSVNRTRTAVFVISAAIAGFGGCMLAMVNGAVTNTSTPALSGLIWVAAVVLFGARSISGAVVAGLFFIVFPQIEDQFTSSTLIPPILFGLGAVALAKNPAGLLADLASSPAVTWVAARIRREPPRPRPMTVTVTEQVPAAALVSGSRESLLSVRDLHAGYGDVEVLRGISFDLVPGKSAAILGPNGAGKSTLCQAIVGLLARTSGQVMFQGEDITRLSTHSRQRLGLVLAPESRGIFPGLSVEDNLALTTNDVEVVGVYARFPVLAQRRRTIAGNLSGGEQQMLALAPVLAKPPPLLIVDEPTLGLAPLIADEVQQILEQIRRVGTSLILVEERPKGSLALVDDFLLLAGGELVSTGPIEDYSFDRAIEAYFG